MSDPQPNYAASWDFLQRFHPGRLIVVTGITLDKKSIPTETFGPDQRGDFLKWVAACALMPANIYFSVGEPMARATKKLERTDIKAVHYLHVDIDPRTGEDHESEKTRILALLRDPPGGLPKPTCIVYSGGGYQAYWQLSEALPVDGVMEVAEDLKRYNLQIERILGADNCHDVSRIMRVPGTINVPDAKKVKKGRVAALSELIEWHDDRVYSVDKFVKATLVRSGVASGAGIGETPKIKAPGNVRRLAHVDDLGDKVAEKCKQCIVNGFIPDDPKGQAPGQPDHFPSRSERLLWVCCELTRASIDTDTIYGVITDPDFKISDSVLDKGAGAERYALRQIERAAEEAVNPMLRELNDKHAVIRNFGGQCVVVEEMVCPILKRPTLTKMGFDHFRNGYMNRMVVVGQKTTKSGNTVDQEMPAGEWWLRHTQRRQYDRIVFAPGIDVPGAMNLWTGFAVTPKPGQWPLTRDHLLKIICGGSEPYFAYLMGWLARMVQQPGSQGEVAVVLRGREGTGKSIIRKNIARWFGRHALAVSQPSHLVGNFNYHLRDVVFLAAEEAFFAGDKRHQSVLKSIITDESLTIERKGVDSETSPNCLHLVMLSNEKWVVPAGQDDRRYFVLDVSDACMKNIPYFKAIQAELDNGGLEAWLYELLTMDLGTFEVRNKPDTAGLQDQKRMSMKDEDQWILHLLRDGLPDTAVHNGSPNVAYPGDRDDRDGLYSCARAAIPGLRGISDVRLAEVLKEWGVESKRHCDGKRCTFPPLKAMREKCDTKWGKQEWPGGIDAEWGFVDEPVPEYRDDDGRPF